MSYRDHLIVARRASLAALDADHSPVMPHLVRLRAERAQVWRAQAAEVQAIQRAARAGATDEQLADALGEDLAAFRRANAGVLARARG